MVKRVDWQRHNEAFIRFDRFIEFSAAETIVYVTAQALLLSIMGLPVASAFLFLGLVFADFLSFAILKPLGISFGKVIPSVVLLSTFRFLLALIMVLLSMPDVLVVTVQILLLLASLYGHYIEPFRVQVNHLSIETGKCNSQSLKIVQLSDIHIERLTHREHKVIELIKDINPDIIVLTGDYLNISYLDDDLTHRHFRDFINALPRPRYGILAVFGTHHSDKIELHDTLFADLPVTVLDGERVDITHEECKYSFVGTTVTRDFDKDLAKIDRAMKDIDPEAVSILLYHTPELPDDAAERKFDLYLAGHTHGGQLALPFYGAIVTHCDYGKLYERGLNKVGETFLYTNRGLGFEGMSAPRARFCSRPEIAVFHV